MSRYTKFWHRARVGTKEPALCGKKPPGGRAWKDSPKGIGKRLPECPKCRALMPNEIWLAT